jgi:hypothetical protein
MMFAEEMAFPEEFEYNFPGNFDGLEFRGIPVVVSPE